MPVRIPERVTEARQLLDDNRIPTMYVRPFRGFERHELWIYPPGQERFVFNIDQTRYAVWDAKGKMQVHTGSLVIALETIQRLYSARGSHA